MSGRGGRAVEVVIVKCRDCLRRAPVIQLGPRQYEFQLGLVKDTVNYCTTRAYNRGGPCVQ